MTEEQRIVLKQQRDLGQIIEAAINLYIQHWQAFLAIAAVVIPLNYAATVVQANIDEPVTLQTVTLALALPQLVVNLIVIGAIAAALRDIDQGPGVNFSRAYDAVFERFWTLLGAFVRAVFHIVLFLITIIGIPWAIMRMVRWAFLAQAVILDGATARASLSRSADAVQGNWWRTLGILLVIGLIAAIAQSIASVPVLLAPPLLAGAVAAIATAAVFPFMGIGTTLLYLDLKARREAEATPATSPDVAGPAR